MPRPINFNTQDPSLAFSSLLCHTALSGCAGAIAATIFTSTGPVGGAIFGASYLLSSRIVSYICKAVNCCPDNLFARVTTFVLSTVGGILTAMAVTAAFGIQLTFTAAVGLTIATIATVITTGLVFLACMCASLYVATAVVLGDNGTVTIRA